MWNTHRLYMSMFMLTIRKSTQLAKLFFCPLVQGQRSEVIDVASLIMVLYLELTPEAWKTLLLLCPVYTLLLMCLFWLPATYNFSFPAQFCWPFVLYFHMYYWIPFWSLLLLMKAFWTICVSHYQPPWKRGICEDTVSLIELSYLWTKKKEKVKNRIRKVKGK